MARTGKHHTIVVDLILPDIIGGKGPKHYTDNDFIKQHCFTKNQGHGRRCLETITASHTRG
jgi:hypothetical protein